MHITELRNRILGEIFDYRQLLDCLKAYSKPRDRIGLWLKRGEIIRVKKGLYVFGDSHRKEPVSRELLANLIYGPSYVTSDYALSYHGMIPERVETVTCVAMAQPRRFDTPLGQFTYRAQRSECYQAGSTVGGGGHTPFLIACPEKAFLDKLNELGSSVPESRADFATFLAMDLRMDPIAIRSMNRKKLKDLAHTYHSPSIDRSVAHIVREARFR